MTTKVMMPEPEAYLYVNGEHRGVSLNFRSDMDLSEGTVRHALITTDQAEAYADARVAESQQWHPIETAPHETLVVLGWYDENEVFKQEIALASAGRRYPGGASDMWWHGQATHWMPLHVPPLPEPMQ